MTIHILGATVNLWLIERNERKDEKNIRLSTRQGSTNQVEVLPSPEPHMFLPNLEAHLWPGLFQLLPSADHQFFPQSTRIIPGVFNLRIGKESYGH